MGIEARKYRGEFARRKNDYESASRARAYDPRAQERAVREAQRSGELQALEFGYSGYISRINPGGEWIQVTTEEDVMLEFPAEAVQRGELDELEEGSPLIVIANTTLRADIVHEPAYVVAGVFTEDEQVIYKSEGLNLEEFIRSQQGPQQ